LLGALMVAGTATAHAEIKPLHPLGVEGAPRAAGTKLRSFLSKNSSSRAFWAGDGWYRSAGAMTLVCESFGRLMRFPIFSFTSE